MMKFLGLNSWKLTFFLQRHRHRYSMLSLLKKTSSQQTGDNLKYGHFELSRDVCAVWVIYMAMITPMYIGCPSWAQRMIANIYGCLFSFFIHFVSCLSWRRISVPALSKVIYHWGAYTVEWQSITEVPSPNIKLFFNLLEKNEYTGHGWPLKKLFATNISEL